MVQKIMNNNFVSSNYKIVLVSVTVMCLLFLVTLNFSPSGKVDRISRNYESNNNSTSFSKILLSDRPSALALDGSDALYFVFNWELRKVDLSTGTEIWTISDRSFWGANFIFVENEKVYLLSSTQLSAVSSNGKGVVWTTRLGNGHVDFSGQIDGPIIRVYYGNQVFEIDADSGAILRDYQRENILWKDNQIEIKKNIDIKKLQGYSYDKKQIIWETPLEIVVDSPYYYQPVDAGDVLFLRTPEAGLCLLQKLTGDVFWCQNEMYLSNVGYNDDKAAFLVASDFSFVRVDLLTGETYTVGSFFPNELPSEIKNNIYNYQVMINKNDISIYFEDSLEVFWGAALGFVNTP